MSGCIPVCQISYWQFFQEVVKIINIIQSNDANSFFNQKSHEVSINASSLLTKILQRTISQVSFDEIDAFQQALIIY